MEYVRVHDWDQYQHYKHRSPPWIKLHSNMLRNRKFIALSLASKGLLMQLWLIASDLEGRVPLDLDEIHFQLRDTKITADEVMLLIEKGFLDKCKHSIAACRQMLSGCYTEERRGEESREEERGPKKEPKNKISKFKPRHDFHYQVKRQFPDGFILLPKMATYAQKKGIPNPQKFFDDVFRKRSLANGYAYKDWIAAWEAWVCKEVEYQKERGNGPVKDLAPKKFVPPEEQLAKEGQDRYVPNKKDLDEFRKKAGGIG